MSKQKQTDTEVHLREPESAFFLSTKQNECVKTRPHVLLCVRQKQQQEFWFLPWWAVIWGSRPGSGCKAPPSCPWQTSRRLSGRVYCFLPRRRLLTRCPEDEPLPVGEKNQREVSWGEHGSESHRLERNLCHWTKKLKLDLNF